MVTRLDTVEQLVAPLLERRDIRLYDVEHAGATLRVLVDRPGGIDLEVLTEVTRELSSALDDVEPVPGRYTLEVSSPGLERPLRRPDHFSDALGTKVRIKTRPEVEGERRVEGVLVAADDDGIAVETEGGQRRLGHDQIERARTVFDWGPSGPRPTPSRGKQRKGIPR
ncbi:ribosome maturation factor RimP [soil metagenome]